MAKKLLTTVIRGINGNRPVVITEGCLLPNGRRQYGVFLCDEDARLADADNLAIATVGETQLSLEQIKIAMINSDDIA